MEESGFAVLACCLIVVFGGYSFFSIIANGLLFGAEYGFATLAVFALILAVDLYAGYRRAKKKP